MIFPIIGLILAVTCLVCNKQMGRASEEFSAKLYGFRYATWSYRLIYIGGGVIILFVCGSEILTPTWGK